MPLDVTPAEILDSLCPCNGWTVSSDGSILCQVTTGSNVTVNCFESPVSDAFVRDFIVQSSRPEVCDPAIFPIVETKGVVWNVLKPPFRAALDEKVFQFYGGNSLVQFNIPDPATNLFTDCNNVLNGQFPGCSRTSGGGACQWKPVTVGSKTGRTTYESCGGNFDFVNNAIQTYSCAIAASFCLRTQWDLTYRAACCRARLEQDFNLTSDVWVRRKFFDVPNAQLASVNPSSEFVDPNNQSESFNPYQLYCDPQWCKTSPACDPVFFELCKWSVTTNDNGPIHACLADTGECADWFKQSTITPTPEGALLTGNHSWLLIDNMIKDYCLSSATSLSDTQSCACVGTGFTSVNQPSAIRYFTSCTTFGITTDCPETVVPVVPVNAAPNDPGMGTAQILTDPVCANITCLDARANATTSFLTSDVLQRALACPTQTCLLAIMNSTFSAADIGTGTRYIANNTQTCFGTSFSANAPDFRIVEFPTLWFWSNVGKSITNPNQTSILRLENVSQDENTPMNWSLTFGAALPSWLQFQGPNFADGVLPGQNMSVEFTLGTVTQVPTYFDLPVTVFMLTSDDPRGTFSKQDLTLNFAIVDVDKPTIPAPSGNDESPNGIPLNVKDTLSPGGWAMIVAIGLCWAVGLLLLIKAFSIRTLVRNALSRKRFESL